MLAFEEELMARLTPKERADLLKGLAVLERALGVPAAEDAEEKAG
jgi:hypothetical protein